MVKHLNSAQAYLNFSVEKVVYSIQDVSGSESRCSIFVSPFLNKNLYVSIVSRKFWQVSTFSINFWHVSTFSTKKKQFDFVRPNSDMLGFYRPKFDMVRFFSLSRLNFLKTHLFDPRIDLFCLSRPKVGMFRLSRFSQQRKEDSRFLVGSSCSKKLLKNYFGLCENTSYLNFYFKFWTWKLKCFWFSILQFSISIK